MIPKPFSTSIYSSYEKDIKRVMEYHQDSKAREVKNRNQIKGLIRELTEASKAETNRGEKLRRGGKSLNVLTTIQFAVKALKSAKGPMNAVDVHDRMVKFGWVSSARNTYATVYAALRSLVLDKVVRKNAQGKYTYYGTSSQTRKAANG